MSTGCNAHRRSRDHRGTAAPSRGAAQTIVLLRQELAAARGEPAGALAKLRRATTAAPRAPAPAAAPAAPRSQPRPNPAETFDVVDAHPRDGPSSEATQLREDLRHRRPIQGARGESETKDRQVGPGLLPRNGVCQAHTHPHPVDHGQDRERAGLHGPWRALLGNEGCVALGQAGRPLAKALYLS